VHLVGCIIRIFPFIKYVLEILKRTVPNAAQVFPRATFPNLFFTNLQHKLHRYRWMP